MYIYFTYFIFFSCAVSRHSQCTLSFPFIIGIVFGLATCLELSRLITLYTRSPIHRVRAWKTTKKKKRKRVSLYFQLSLLSYPFHFEL